MILGKKKKKAGHAHESNKYKHIEVSPATLMQVNCLLKIMCQPKVFKATF